MNWDALDWSILGPAFGAGLMVLLTHVPLGTKVLDRGIIFIDLAIAQIAALGAIATQMMFHDPSAFAIQCGAIIAALIGASGLTWTDKKFSDKQEALIGTLFVLAATGAILLLANDPHAGEQLKEILVGQILWVNWSQLILPAIASIALLAVILWAHDRLPRWAFYSIFAIAITQSVQFVGVYLVFASLIIPALATDNRRGSSRILVAYAIGITGYGLGLIVSALSDLPSGAVIVWLLGVVGLLQRLIFPLR